MELIVGVISLIVSIVVGIMFVIGKHQIKREETLKKMVVEFYGYEEDENKGNRYKSVLGDYIRDDKILKKRENVYCVFSKTSENMGSVEKEEMFVEKNQDEFFILIELPRNVVAAVKKDEFLSLSKKEKVFIQKSLRTGYEELEKFWNMR